MMPDFSILITTLILGVIEGLTEFIPVSSTGHLILGAALLPTKLPNSDVFVIFIQLGAILAVIFARLARVWSLAIGFFTNAIERWMGLKILVAFFPAVIAGVLLHDYIKHVLFSPLVVAISLVVGGIIMLFVERTAPAPRAQTMDEISMKTAFHIGLCQLCALIPGISRSGASIVGAQFLGVERRAATEFSFFLAIPTLTGAALYDLYKNLDLLTPLDAPVFAAGSVAAFLSALVVVKTLIRFVGHYGFAPFAYYRIVVGLLVLAFLV